MSHRIIFIDSNVAEYQSLIPQLPEDSEIIVLGASKDGVIQILDALQGKTEIAAIDIISHGASGALMLGSIELSNANLAEYAEQFTQIGMHLSATADILLYGCEVAQGRQGQAFIEQLSLLTGVNVAASINLTGAEALGGDWILEVQTGLITANALQLSYSGVLSSDEFRVNTTTDGDQSFPSITGLSNGGFVVAWLSDPGDIFAQRYDANGVAQGVEFIVAASTETVDLDSVWHRGLSITALADGGFALSWESFSTGDSNGIFARRYDVNGVAQGDQIGVGAINDITSTSIAALKDGGFVVSWGFVDEIFVHRYDANGVAQGGGFMVNTTTASYQVEPSITALSNGDFVVNWTSGNQDGSNSGVYAQRYDVNGVAQGVEFRVNTYTEESQGSSSITALTNGGFVISWSSEGQDGSMSGIYAQRYDANGFAQGAEFRVNTTTAGFQNDSSITALSNGGFVVNWKSLDLDGSYYGIYAQRYDANGVAQGSQFRVNATTDAGTDPSITALTDGGFVVSWTSLGDIKAKRYDANGNEVAPGSSGIEPADRLFNWAESTYTALFPNHATSQEIAGYHARLYENGNALGEQSSNIYFYDGHSIVLVGTVDDFLPGAIAAGF